MGVTPAQALAVVSLSSMKTEVRIEASETSHDELLTAQLVAAVSFVKESTGRALADLAELRPSIVAVVRAQYDGLREVSPNAAHNAWLEPFRDIA